MVRASFGAGFGTCAVGVNRRQKLADGRMVVGVNPDGPADHAVGVLRLRDESGGTLATVVQYGCHPTTLGFENRLHSPDYPGAAKRFVERNLGGVCLFLQGCAGNVGPGPEGFGADVAAMRRIGETLGAAAVQTALEIDGRSRTHRFSRVVESGAPLGVWTSEARPGDETLAAACKTVALPLKELPPYREAKAAYERFAEELDELRRRRAPGEEIRDATYKVKRARIAMYNAELYAGRKEALIEAHFIRLGDAVLAGAPLEPFAETGMEIRRRSPFAHTFVGGYANGVIAYLPVAAAYGEGGYEAESSPYAMGAAEKFADEVVGCLHALR